MKQTTEKSVCITFDPEGIEIQSQPGETLLDCARDNNIRIAGACGGRGICKSCIVHVMDGEIPEASAGDKHFFSPSKLAKGWRRACQINPVADCHVHIPTRAQAQSVRMQVDGADFWVQPEPAVRTYTSSLQEPTLDDQQADCDRLIAAVNKQAPDACTSMDLDVLRALPQILRRNNRQVQVVVRGGEIIAVQPQNARLTGLAVDLGTTNIGVFLIDLHSGTTIASTGIENPQAKFGSDVIARIGVAVQSNQQAEAMQQLVVEALNAAAADLCRDHHVPPQDITDVVVVGNTAMHHLFLRLPVNGLGLAPFAPVVAEAMDLKARNLGLITAPGANVHMMANIAGFVGADHTAMLMGICADTEKRTVIALDIGTNTEISLIHESRITSLSCPSGPALEGGHIVCGMRAATGAIEAVTVDGENIGFQTLGDSEPLGLCGSAVLDAVAAFYAAGGINARGQIREDYTHTINGDEGTGFLLHSGTTEVIFYQKDIRAVQLAKGSIRAGIDLLLETAELGYDQIDKIVVAGAFGNYIRIESACAIGMLPNLPLDRFEQVGNAAGIGAKLALLSMPLRDKARDLALRSKHIIQAGNAGFNSLFMNSINFPKIN